MLLLDARGEENHLRIFVLILLLASAVAQLTFIHPALAAETGNGAKLFSSHCSSCHIGGGNILITNKTLTKEALSEYLKDYDKNPIEAIINQVYAGKGAMPAFKDKLSTEEILELAAYVFQKAEQGWLVNKLPQIQSQP